MSNLVPDVVYAGTYRVGVIGDTGRGGYSHGLDTAFTGLPRVDIVAVADPDATGRAAALARVGAMRGYAHFRDMLSRERLDVVAIAPSWLDQREAMVVAAAEAGVKAIYCEKPLAQSLDQADRLLAACDARGVKLAVAHQNRAFPAPWLIRHLIATKADPSGEQGFDRGIGRLRSMRAWPKLDSRGGPLELMIHGTHMFDLMRFFAGDARWCHARVCRDGRDATPADVLEGPMSIGPMAGDDIVATFGFDGGVTGTFESMRSDDGGHTDYLRMEVSGTSGTLAFRSSYRSPVSYLARPFALPDEPGPWERLQPPAADLPAGVSELHPGNQALVRDLLAAVEEERSPLSSGHDARAALEMILGAYEAHAAGGRVFLPLASRTHPLSRWRAASQT